MHEYKSIIMNSIMGGRNLTKFASDAGINAGNLSRILKGQNTSPEIIRKIALASDNKKISFERLLNLFVAVPDGEITDTEFEIFSEALSVDIIRSVATHRDKVIDNAKNFNMDLFSKWIKFTNKKGLVDANLPIPTYEDVICIADIFNNPVNFYLKRNFNLLEYARNKHLSPEELRIEILEKAKEYLEQLDINDRIKMLVELKDPDFDSETIDEIINIIEYQKWKKYQTKKQ